MAQRLRTLPALPKVLSSIPSNHMVLTTICNEVWCPLLACRHTHRQNIVYIINKKLGAGEMAQRLRALPILPNVLSSIPSNHMVAHNHL